MGNYKDDGVYNASEHFAGLERSIEYDSTA